MELVLIHSIWKCECARMPGITCRGRFVMVTISVVFKLTATSMVNYFSLQYRAAMSNQNACRWYQFTNHTDLHVSVAIGHIVSSPWPGCSWNYTVDVILNYIHLKAVFSVINVSYIWGAQILSPSLEQGTQVLPHHHISSHGAVAERARWHSTMRGAETAECFVFW